MRAFREGAIPDLPGWVFEIEEVSANVYEVTGIDGSGHRVQVRGADPDEVLEQARTGARKLQADIARR